MAAFRWNLPLAGGVWVIALTARGIILPWSGLGLKLQNNEFVTGLSLVQVADIHQVQARWS